MDMEIQAKFGDWQGNPNLPKPPLPEVSQVKTGGVFIYETFVKTPTGESYHNPTNPDFHLDRDELPKAFSELDIIFYKEQDAINLRGEKVRVASFVGRKK